MFKIILFFIILLQGLVMSATLKQIQYDGKEVASIFEKNNNLPIFNLQLVFQNSGYINDKEFHGIANIVAKILEEGTKKDGSIAFARELENNAISIETSTGFETFVIEVNCLKSEYHIALKLLDQLLKDPNLTQDTLDKIKMLQISKLQQKQNDFDYIASSNLKKLQYKGTPLEYTSLGDIESIKKIQLKDLKIKLDTILNIDNLIVVVGGDIKFKQFSKDIKPLLGNLKSHGVIKFDKIKMLKGKKEKIVKKETQQAYIYFSSPFDINYNSKDAYKAKVASFILGGSGFGSRLMEEIRVKNGLAYSAYGHISNHKSYSHFTGYLQTKLENRKKAKKMVISIVKDFVTNGVTKKELQAAKDFLQGSEPLRTETFSQRLNRAFHLYYKGLPFDYPKTELKKIDSLTLEQLNSFIKSHKEITELSFSIVTK